MIRRYQAVLLVAALLLSGCSQKGVIPPRKMASILHDMYVLDAQVSLNSEYVDKADTTSVYGALLAEYGYTGEDFNKSIDYYLSRPVKFKEIFNDVFNRFESEVVVNEIDPRNMVFDELVNPAQPEKARNRRLRKSSKSPSGGKE